MDPRHALDLTLGREALVEPFDAEAACDLAHGASLRDPPRDAALDRLIVACARSAHTRSIALIVTGRVTMNCRVPHASPQTFSAALKKSRTTP